MVPPGPPTCPRFRRRPILAAVSPAARRRPSRAVHAPGGRERRARSRVPGQFFMLEAPGRGAAAADEPLPRPRRRARVPDRPGRAGDAGARASSRARRCTCSARSGTASTSTSSGRCSSAAASASRRCPTSPALDAHRRCSASAATGTPGGGARPERRGLRRAELVTELLPDARRARLRAGADARGGAWRAHRAQLAWEAPMACGYGACYGCAVEIDGERKRLCVEGPVLCAP